MQGAAQTSFGLLTDLHYDGDPGILERLRAAVAVLNRQSVDFSVFLGDCIVADNAHHAQKFLRKTAAVFQALEHPLFYLPGNHDLDCLTKERFFKAIDRAGETTVRSFVKNGVTFICLDANFSADGIEYHGGNFDWTNAYIPADQLQWLKNRLTEAAQPVVVFCHQRLDPSPRHTIINAVEVRKMMEASGKVTAVFQGHNHAGDHQEINGIAYHTIKALKDGANPVIAKVPDLGKCTVQEFQ